MPEFPGHFRPPRLTAAPSSPAAGELYYDTTLNALYYYNGTIWVPVGGTPAAPTVQAFMTGGATGTYTTPTGVIAIIVECWGAGGGGGGAPAPGASLYAGGAGGGGGGYSRHLIAAPAATYAYAVGARGTAGTTTPTAGGTGGDTTFGATIVVAKGGPGGAVGTAVGAGAQSAVRTAGAVTGTGNIITLRGGDGMWTRGTVAGSGFGGWGGGAGLNSGGVTMISALSGTGPQGDHGCGGHGGQGQANAGATAGGVGGAGMIVVTEFYS